MHHSGQGKSAAVNRLLTATSIVISAVVILFTIYMISASDDLAEYVAHIYNSSYAVQTAATELRGHVVSTQLQMERFLADPQRSAGLFLDTQAESWQGTDDRTSAFDAEEQMVMEDIFTKLGLVSENIVALAFDDDIEGARELYDQEGRPLFDRLRARLNELISQENDRMQDYRINARELNHQINSLSVALAIGVIAIAVGATTMANRAIRKTNADVYHRDVLFGLISSNVDEVFEIYSLDEHRLDYVSDNLERVFGVPASSYMRDNNCLRSNIDANDRDHMDDVYFRANNQEVESFDFHYQNPQTGKEQVFHSVLYPVREDKGPSDHHVLLTRDVTEDTRMRMELEEALADAEAANAVKQDFLSRMSHEVRTPINAIIGMEALASTSGGDLDRIKHCLRQISVASRHLLSLVNDILDMSKIESGRLELVQEPINLDGLISDLVLMMGSRTDLKQQTLTVKNPRCAHRYLIGDELRLRQILLNLLTNANKYTQNGGKITLTISQFDRPDGSVDTCFSVSDNGIGVAEEDRERIFQPFERGDQAGSQPGTGLGLSISRHLVEDMGGTLAMDSMLGRGSTFSFCIPLGIDTESPQITTAAEAAKGRIMIVEDNEINMEIAQELLEGAGYEVTGAGNGREAVELFEASGPGQYDAIIMDIQMPVMDGFEAAARMREDFRRLGSTPILAMTANVFSSDSARKNLFDGFISKPIDPGRMISQIKKALSKVARRENSNGPENNTLPE